MEDNDDENEVAFLSNLLSGVTLPKDPLLGVDTSWKKVDESTLKKEKCW